MSLGKNKIWKYTGFCVFRTSWYLLWPPVVVWYALHLVFTDNLQSVHTKIPVLLAVWDMVSPQHVAAWSLVTTS